MFYGETNQSDTCDATLEDMDRRFTDDIDFIGIDRRSMEEAFVPMKRDASSIMVTNEVHGYWYYLYRPSGVSAEVVLLY